MAPFVSGVVLAAGQSSRLGRPKQLLPYRGNLLLQHVLDAVVASKVDERLLILGAHRQKIEAAVDTSGFRLVENDAFAEGHSTSVRAAIENLDPRSDAAIFILGDQPEITPEIIDAVIFGFDPPRIAIVVPRFSGKRGNPVLFRSTFYGEISELLGDRGARPLINRHPDIVAYIDLPGDTLRDIDTEEDYQALLETGIQ
jgi:molybdenum cofactor cytidylyltransferase